MDPVQRGDGPGVATIIAAANAAARAIPPAWPLAASVAVNPFLGQAHEGLPTVAARLARVAGARVTMPRSWYLDQVESGAITDADLMDALAVAPAGLRPAGLADLKAAAATPTTLPLRPATIAELAASASGTDWPGLIEERLGAWAAGYFDDGQALWVAPRGRSAYAAWRLVATHDLTPEILGLGGFAVHVADAPEDATEALAAMVQRLGLPQAALETYFHQLLMTLGGWAQYARYRLWQAELGGGNDATLIDLLVIRLVWEVALLERHRDLVEPQWQSALAMHALPVTPTAGDVLDTILQEAAERAAQRELARQLAAEAPAPAASGGRPALQAAFCIDVRSEVIRRALESLDGGIRTLGFAGFFGLPVAHRRFASDVQEHRLPVLLNAGLSSRADLSSGASADQQARFRARARRAWGRFKLAAVSSFAFVEATGPVYAAKPVGDALGRPARRPHPEPAPRLDPSPGAEAGAATAEAVLRAMSLTGNFARLVLLVGHGASVVNNPHASALHCGACGGYPGDVNARLLAALLNDPAVRAGLAARGIEVPADTWFVGALHDTTTDQVELYAADGPVATHSAELAAAREWLEAAGKLARGERALRLPHAQGEGSLDYRSRDWAEVRPEWALAGCKAFIAAPRGRTAGKAFDGRAFLHDYDWAADRDYRVLELILTAPVVVASWISLQYYGSTVAPETFGGGNKLLHNVTGGIGVVEGNGGLLRAGLPWQSVHDGERYMHEPLRLSVCIEAPREAMSGILRRHAAVRMLFDNRWLHLFALDEGGRMAWRYAGDLQWSAMEPAAPAPGHDRRAVN